MLELLNLIAVIGKSIKFINYRTKEIISEITLISKESEKSEISLPLFVKVNLQQTEMLIVVNGGGFFSINLFLSLIHI